MTFSIAACDLDRGDWGVAVASRFLAVGAVVPYANAGVGAIATQSFADVTFGPRGLAILRGGEDAAAACELLLHEDTERETRQLGIVDATGRAASFTGTGCMSWAGSRSGTSYAAQGNILAGPEVLEALGSSFEGSGGEQLADRLLNALEAADRAGGDRRGRQSAALLVTRAGGGYGRNHDRMIDLRVDDGPAPITELRRLLMLNRLYFDRPNLELAIDLGPDLRAELATLLDWSPKTAAAAGFGRRLFEAISMHNLEERWIDDRHVDPVLLEYLRELKRDEKSSPGERSTVGSVS